MNSVPTLDSIQFAARTERGLREENQDAMTDFHTPFGAVYLIADGMGGAQGGAEASLLTAEGYRRYLTSLSAELSVTEALQRATSATNSEIRLRSHSGDPTVAGMGSTVVLAVFTEAGPDLNVTVAHIGDSRAYLLRHGVLQRLTRDHSTVQHLVDNDQITMEEARTHPDSNIITRALGPYEDVQIETTEQAVEVGDLLLLCSDGLCGYVDDAALDGVLSHTQEIGAAADALVALALQSGSTDNVTLQVLKIGLAKPDVPAKAKAGLLSRAAIALAPGGPGSPPSGLARGVSRRGLSSAVLRHGVSLLLGVGLGLLAAHFFRAYISAPLLRRLWRPHPKPAEVRTGSPLPVCLVVPFNHPRHFGSLSILVQKPVNQAANEFSELIPGGSNDPVLIVLHR